MLYLVHILFLSKASYFPETLTNQACFKRGINLSDSQIIILLDNFSILGSLKCVKTKITSLSFQKGYCRQKFLFSHLFSFMISSFSKSLCKFIINWPLWHRTWVPPFVTLSDWLFRWRFIHSFAGCMPGSHSDNPFNSWNDLLFPGVAGEYCFSAWRELLIWIKINKGGLNLMLQCLEADLLFKPLLSNLLLNLKTNYHISLSFSMQIMQ